MNLKKKSIFLFEYSFILICPSILDNFSSTLLLKPLVNESTKINKKIPKNIPVILEKIETDIKP